jgi:hypothetical protein
VGPRPESAKLRSCDNLFVAEEKIIDAIDRAGEVDDPMNSIQGGMRPCWILDMVGDPCYTVREAHMLKLHHSNTLFIISHPDPIASKKYTTYEHTSNGMLCGASPHFCVLLTACRKSLPTCTALGGSRARNALHTSSHLQVQSHMDVKFLAKYGLESSGRILHNRSFASEHDPAGLRRLAYDPTRWGNCYTESVCVFRCAPCLIFVCEP